MRLEVVLIGLAVASCGGGGGDNGDGGSENDGAEATEDNNAVAPEAAGDADSDGAQLNSQCSTCTRGEACGTVETAGLDGCIADCEQLLAADDACADALRALNECAAPLSCDEFLQLASRDEDGFPCADAFSDLEQACDLTEPVDGDQGGTDVTDASQCTQSPDTADLPFIHPDAIPKNCTGTALCEELQTCADGGECPLDVPPDAASGWEDYCAGLQCVCDAPEAVEDPLWLHPLPTTFRYVAGSYHGTTQLGDGDYAVEVTADGTITLDVEGETRSVTWDGTLDTEDDLSEADLLSPPGDLRVIRLSNEDISNPPSVINRFELTYVYDGPDSYATMLQHDQAGAALVLVLTRED